METAGKLEDANMAFKNKKAKNYCLILLWSATFAGFPFLGYADLKIVWDVETTTLRNSTREASENHSVIVAYLRPDLARLDLTNDLTCQIDMRQRRLAWVDHKTRVTSLMELPIDLSKIFTDPKMLMMWNSIGDDLREIDEEVGTFKGHAVKVFRWVSKREAQIQYSVWVDSLPELEGLENVLQNLFENCSFLDPAVHVWMHLVYTKPGIPLRLMIDREMQAFSVVKVYELESVVEVGKNPERYLPPAEYEQAPFRIDEYVKSAGSNQ